MIELYSHIRPFNDLPRCGDFIVVYETDNYFFWGIGDVGGHGTQSVGDLAQMCSQVLRENHSLDLRDIFDLLHLDKDIRAKGMTLFLSRVYKKSPLFEYLSVGNIRAIMVREGEFKELTIQEGIVGYIVPTLIDTHLIKLHKNDIVIVGTDGVSLHSRDLGEIINGGKVLNGVAEQIVERFHHQDDSACSIMKYDVSNTCSDVYDEFCHEN